jgi:hypothetical protein
MSQENVEVVRRAWEAFLAAMERGDPGAFSIRGSSLRTSSG